MMKHASFAALIYREYAICKKALCMTLISVPIFSALPILIALSLRFGNLAMLPDIIITDIRSNNDLILKLNSIIAPCMLSISVSEAAVLDTNSKWDNFRRSTPVSPARMAMAKYVFYAIILALSFLLAVISLGVFTLSMDIPMVKSDIAIILLFITSILIMSVLSQAFIMLFRSVDKGMLVMMASVAVPILLLGRKPFSMTAEGILGFAERNLLLFPLVMGITLVIGFALTALLYKRRER